MRGEDGVLAVLGHANAFTTTQWLRADGDGRSIGIKVSPGMSPAGAHCDKLGCVGAVPGGQVLSIVADRAAFEEDCRRADLIVTSLYAPASCAAELIIDRGSLEQSGALALWRQNGAWAMRGARAPGEDRPWSPAPKPWRPRGAALHGATAGTSGADSASPGQDSEREGVEARPIQ